MQGLAGAGRSSRHAVTMPHRRIHDNVPRSLPLRGSTSPDSLTLWTARPG